MTKQFNLQNPTSPEPHVNEAPAGAASNFLADGGEMGALIREFDWANNPLGRTESWPQSLKTAVRIMLTLRQPLWIGWGEELIYLYNDPYKSLIGGKHVWEQSSRPTAYRATRNSAMVDNTTKRDRQDRPKVAASEEYEIRRYLLQKTGTRKREALELIKRFGKDRATLLREARKLATTGWATALKL